MKNLRHNYCGKFFLVVLVSAFIIVTTQGYASSSEPKKLRPFTFILGFIPSGDFSPFYVGLEKGWYREEGLDIKILQGRGSADTVRRIAAGQGDAGGSADFSAYLASRANEDLKVKAIFLELRRPQHAIFVRGNAGINTPKDFEGRTFGTTPGNSHIIVFPYFAKLANFNADLVKWVMMDASTMGPALVMGKLDGAPMYASHEARLQKEAKNHGVTLKLFAFSDYGLDLYSNVIYAREETIAKDADALKAFLRGTSRAYKYTFWDPKNIEEACKILVKHNPEVDLDAAIGAASVASRYAITEEVKKGKVALGQFEYAQVEKTRDIYTQYLNLKRKLPVEELYTNDLLPEKK